MRYALVAGWTAPIDISLLSRDATPSGSMLGMSAEIVIADREGRQIDTSGDVTIPDTAQWVVRYSPDAADLTPGNYRMRVKVTDASGKISYFPSGEWDELTVQPEI